MIPQRVLVAGVAPEPIRSAFRRAGVEAWSGSEQPARDDGPHIQAPVHDTIRRGWDVVILRPDFAALTLSGNWCYGRGGRDQHVRTAQMRAAMREWRAAKMHAYVGCALEFPTSVLLARVGLEVGVQYIQPYRFGHPESKKTGLALHYLPRLRTTHDVRAQMRRLPRVERERVLMMTPSEDRQALRSEPYSGVVDAMVTQWTGLRRIQ